MNPKFINKNKGGFNLEWMVLGPFMGAHDVSSTHHNREEEWGGDRLGGGADAQWARRRERESVRGREKENMGLRERARETVGGEREP